MNILFTGKGTSGSWVIRGKQMAEALGARAIPMASVEECEASDVIVGVKRIPALLLERIRFAQKPFVWDVVDAWPNRVSGSWNQEQAMDWCKAELDRLQPDAVIWPNERMRQDMGGGGKVIYHHHRPGIALNPIRPRIQTIGYEGSPLYIEGWAGPIAEQCRRLGAVFLVNPVSLADVDVVLALRGAAFQGYPHQQWKSQIKLANAHASGTPFIGQPEAGYLENTTGAECWVSDSDGLGRALDALSPIATRWEIHERFRAASFPIEQAAAQYRSLLCALKS